MRNRGLSLTVSAVFLAALLTACGGDDGGPTGPAATGDPLTAAEASELGIIVLTLGFQALGGASGSFGVVDGIGVASDQIDQEFELLDIPCHLGGSININGRVQGTVDQSGDSYDLNYTANSRYNACAIAASGQTFQFNSPDGVSLNARFRAQNGAPVGTQTLAYAGSFAWSASDGRSGTCQVDLDMAWSLQSVNFSGGICGHSLF